MPAARSAPKLGWLALLWAVIGLICARYDLAISQAVVRRDADWALAGQRFGELPGVVAFALAAAAGYAKPAQQHLPWWQRQLPWLLCSLGAAVAVALCSYRLFGHRLNLPEGAVALALALVITRLLRAPLGHGLQFHPDLDRAAAWTVRLGIWSWLLVSSLKLAWGRVRFRDLQPLADNFTPWYSPQGWTGHASFPSGHAALGWLLLTCVLVWPRGCRQYLWTLGLCVAWGVFVASSRVVVGAHYLSDVLFSTAFAFGVVGYAQRSARLPPASGAGAQREGLERDGLPVGK